MYFIYYNYNVYYNAFYIHAITIHTLAACLFYTTVSIKLTYYIRITLYYVDSEIPVRNVVIFACAHREIRSGRVQQEVYLKPSDWGSLKSIPSMSVVV